MDTQNSSSSSFSSTNFDQETAICSSDSTRKRPRHETLNCGSRYKGVVKTSNGHWGAQIYANQSRYWLGTFATEQDAALAYDNAAAKIRTDDGHRNIRQDDLTLQDQRLFQSFYSFEDVIGMIKNGSYVHKFNQFASISRTEKLTTKLVDFAVDDKIPCPCTPLFDKKLTPSDVGKLNRFVIPKKFAVKYFPYVSAESPGNGDDEIELACMDVHGNLWKFRYSYWRSSQSYVITRGWNRFVRDKGLKKDDVVTFYSCKYEEKVLLIAVSVREEEPDAARIIMKEEDLEMGLREAGGCEFEGIVKKKVLKLFGVEIYVKDDDTTLKLACY